MYLIYVSDLQHAKQAGKADLLALAALAVHEKDWNNTLFEISRFQRESQGVNKGVNILDTLSSIKDQSLTKTGGLLRTVEGFAKLQAKLGATKTWAFLSKVQSQAETPASAPNLEQLCQRMLDHVGTFCWSHEQHGMLFAPESVFAVLDGIVSQRKQINLLYSEFEWGNFLEIPSSAVVENPVRVNLADSPFVQMATLNAFMAAQRFDNPQGKESYLWDLLGPARGEFLQSTEPPPAHIPGIRLIE